MATDCQHDKDMAMRQDDVSHAGCCEVPWPSVATGLQAGPPPSTSGSNLSKFKQNLSQVHKISQIKLAKNSGTPSMTLAHEFC